MWLIHCPLKTLVSVGTLREHFENVKQLSLLNKFVASALKHY